MPTPGYYRYPTIHRNTIVFVSEDDLWTVPSEGGIARRLTANLGSISHPFFSPDGKTLAFTGREEGHNEVYTMPAEGGSVRRITYLGVNSFVIGWTPDGSQILFSSDAGQPFDRVGVVYGVSPEGGPPGVLPIGPAVSISMTTGKRTVIGRNNNDPARWKRYKGGTAGDLWVDSEGKGEFRRLITLLGNHARPMWLGDRIVFLSDHEGFGNLYSCRPDGSDLRRHTHREDYFVRFPNTDGEHIVYHAGADLMLYDPRTETERKVEIAYHSPRVHRQRRFVEAAKYLEGYAPHPQGHMLAINARGKSFTFGHWEGAVTQQSSDDPLPSRYRLTDWLNDGERLVLVSDASGEDALEIHYSLEAREPLRLEGLDIGRPNGLLVSPTHDHVIVSNHRNELIFVDLVEQTARVIDRSLYHGIAGMDWSPDGRWVAYGFAQTQYTTCLKLWDRTTGDLHFLTEPVLHDTEPAFDPEGKYLYFLGMRDLNPVYDNLNFQLSFPKGVRPFLLTLKSTLPSPFLPGPRAWQEEPKPEAKSTETTPEEEATGEADKKSEIATSPVEIDLDGIAGRVVAFPVPEGLYGRIAGIKGKALFVSFPVEGVLGRNPIGEDPKPKGVLEMYDFKEQKHEPLVAGVSGFAVSRDGKTVVVRAAKRLRVLRAGQKPDEKSGGDGPGRKSGWIDLGRVKVSVEPGVEWLQMMREAWRLQREHFWTPDMSQIDWNAVWERYRPLIERIGTRGEYSDLMWEMQGELGTSHAYEMGGDYRPEPAYPQGFLGADYAYDVETDTWRIARIVRGTPGETRASSPLLGPGINIHVGDRLKAINGRKLSRAVSPQEALVHLAESEVVLTVESDHGGSRDVTVTTLRSEFPVRYREWVEANRRRVHEATDGRVGYVHIPDMGGHGFAEFHRLYLAEVDRDGLIIDVRYNRGGHVSQLLIEKLARKRVGYDVQRWGQPEPYPSFSPAGPMVALTNQFAGSDGDIFSHVFKLMKLGPLIGKRTWGGVVGIWPRSPLADGSITTQPEFSFWFHDVGWGVENYGTDPDIDIDIAPQDYAEGRDPQMEKAIALILECLDREPPGKPTFTNRPNLAPSPLLREGRPAGAAGRSVTSGKGVEEVVQSPGTESVGEPRDAPPFFRDKTV